MQAAFGRGLVPSQGDKDLRRILALVFLFLIMATSTASAKARPVDKRIQWLQQRVQVHKLACARTLSLRSKWHCRALIWTKRELLQAQQEARTLITHDWQIATILADRVFPGTQAWLMSCSSGEGGHGRFVWNVQGSGAGGWMQFMRSTYEPYARAARVVVRQKGYIVKESLWSYYEPLGQALTAAYMRSLGISHYHWNPWVDRLCN